MNFLEAAKRIDADDEVAAKVGAKIAAVFHLKRDDIHADRWKTVWGNKSDAGLARTMLRVIKEETEG